ncbi:MAG: endonuclease III [Candidatus Campbellbacteria bacterium]|nr:endonuclease III [Candidatus Campbellbacteria bacterium]
MMFQEKMKRARTINARLKKLFPNASMALRYGNNWELLVAVILSAQCTDKKVNEVTRELFKKYKTIDDYVNADPKEFALDIHSTGFFNAKTKNILGAAKKILNDFDGEIPKTMQEILTIPGVARKTANVVLGNAYGIVEGIAVDTHVKRFAQKFALTSHADPKKIEQDLMILFPKKDWFVLTYRLIEYGRQICPARVHDCTQHPISKLYPDVAKRWPKAR